jgi:Fe-S-cluster containining protein
MSIYQKVRSVERVFNLLEKDIEKLKSKTSLHCLSGCGECCKKPDIEATVLEFLPYAYHLYKNHTIFDQYDILEEYAKHNDICHLFSPFTTSNFGGSCTEYKYRGLICRLFGFSAYLNKYGEAQLSTCKLIKNDQPLAIQRVQDLIDVGDHVPIMRDYYYSLMAIDRELAEKRYPINIAIKKALERVCFYYAYRGSKSS